MNQTPMTRIVNNVELAKEASLKGDDALFPVVVVLRDGTRWVLDGVKWMVDREGNPVEFQMQVGPVENPSNQL